MRAKGDLVNGEVKYIDGGVLMIHTYVDIALKNYSGKNATTGREISCYAIRTGSYDWNGTPLELWDCGTPYTPPPLTPEQIKAAQDTAIATAQREKQRVFLAQSNAVVWLQSQVTNGDASAQFSLGEHYLNGQGCETNRDKAIYWFTQAAANGNMDASNRLSKLKSP